AAALRLVDRGRGRADEQQLRLLLAVLVVEREVDFHRLVAVRPEAVESGFEHAVEAAPDLAGPAHGENQLLLVVLDAGLVGLEALHVGEAVGVEVLEQRRERLLELTPRNALENRNVGVEVNFVPHALIVRLKSGHQDRTTTARRRVARLSRRLPRESR